MNKRIILLLCAMLIVAFVFGACAKTGDLALPEKHDNADVPALASFGQSPNNDATIVVLEVNGNKVYKDKFNSAYSSLCSQYGVAEDDPNLSGLIKETALDLLLSEQVVRIKLKELGYMDLSADDVAKAKMQAQSELDYALAYEVPDIIAQLGEGYTEQELDDAIIAREDSLLAEYDLTREAFIDYFEETIALENARTELLKDAVPSEEDVVAAYNNAVEASKEAIGDDLAAYEDYLNQNGMTYYIPQGVRLVRHILFKLDDESTSKVGNLRQSGDDAGADAALEEALKLIQAEADAVLLQFQNDEITFTEGIEKFNEDPGMTSNPDGYEIYEGNGTYVESFSKGAMSLQNIGDISGLVASDYGYHIIEYTSDKAAGPVPLAVVRDQLYEGLLTSLQDNAWGELVAQWKTEVTYTFYREVL